GKESFHLASASARGWPPMTSSWIAVHCALAAGLEDSRLRMKSALPSGTPALRRLESSRVKVSTCAPETLERQNIIEDAADDAFLSVFTELLAVGASVDSTDNADRPRSATICKAAS